jgi:putative glutamine amidotransferase
MRIGITETFKEDTFDQYVNWIHRVDSQIEILRLSHLLANEDQVTMIDGLVLSGGGDIHPSFYHREDALHIMKGMNKERDDFELDIIEKSLEKELPILGICRGMQIMNVYLGGSLYPDVVSEGYSPHATGTDEPVMHTAATISNTMLHALSGVMELNINSFHHQSVSELGKGLIRSAEASDGVVEAAEWALKDSMPFLLLVQWHPERMTEDFLSHKIARLFLREVTNFNHTRINITDN